MASCLGISTENNLIKYAKISKDRDNYTVDSFGIKFFDKLEDTIAQIIEETQSENIPININLTDELYNKFEVFSGLKKKDIDAVLSSEFELLCEEKGYNFNTLISKYILSNNTLNKEKNNVLYVSANKTDIVGKLQKLQEHRINNLIPIPISLYSLANIKKENTAIINIEDKTSVTIIVNGEIFNVYTIELGMKQILEKITKKENSYARAYDACKNTTIYTMNMSDNQLSGNEYLEEIMPVLYDIVLQTKQIFDENLISMQKILLTGTATIINNIELYFQEYFSSTKCELLLPNFLENKANGINIREYIEVNSAVSLALQGLGKGIQDTNFKNIYAKGNIFQEIKRIANKDIQIGKNNKGFDKVNINLDLKGSLDKIEKDMVRVASTFIFIIIVYAIISTVLSSSINNKIGDVELVISDTKKVIEKIGQDESKVKNKTTEYAERIKKLEDINTNVTNQYKYKRAIPNLLSQIMSVIPKEVQLTSIENTVDSKVIIKAQSEKYEELGYFAAVLKNQGILLNVSFTPGVRENAIIKIDIEGNLP